MGVSASYTVFCDRCPMWEAEAPTRREATTLARMAGFRRRVDETTGSDRLIIWLCPGCNPDFCGSVFTYPSTGAQTWCLQKPEHTGLHDWQQR